MRGLAALFALWLAVLLPARAMAEDLRPQPVPAVLTDVRLLADTPGETRLRLEFAPRPNSWAPIDSGADARPDPRQSAIGFALTTRANSAVAPPGLKGLVRAISFDQADSVLILRFSASAPASVAARADGPTALIVTLSARPEKPAAIAQGPAGPLPAARQPAAGEEGYEMVMLRYADVSEVVGLLTDGLTVKSNDVFTPREPGFGSTSLTGGAYQASAPAMAGADDQPLGQSVDSAVAVDRRLNAVWLRGSPAQIARMKAEIALIDVPVDSVILETQLVELTESGARSVGIDFTNANGQIGLATVQTGEYIPSGFTANSGQRLTSAQLQAAVYAQVQKGEGRIVSRPRISARSGASAKIITGDALPILTSITLSGVNGVSQQVQYVNVGVTLQIAPRVSDDGFVTSHVFCVVSSVTGYSSGYPTISQREAETSATVKDGESFVIGGLTQTSTISSDAKVPILGDVPLLGQAFHNKKLTKAKTELYILVTPHIVRHAAPPAPLPEARP